MRARRGLRRRWRPLALLALLPAASVLAGGARTVRAFVPSCAWDDEVVSWPTAQRFSGVTVDLLANDPPERQLEWTADGPTAAGYSRRCERGTLTPAGARGLYNYLPDDPTLSLAGGFDRCPYQLAKLGWDQPACASEADIEPGEGTASSQTRRPDVRRAVRPLPGRADARRGGARRAEPVPPVAVDDLFYIGAASSVAINVLDNDRSVEGIPYWPETGSELVNFTQPRHGTVAMASTYLPCGSMRAAARAAAGRGRRAATAAPAAAGGGGASDWRVKGTLQYTRDPGAPLPYVDTFTYTMTGSCSGPPAPCDGGRCATATVTIVASGVPAAGTETTTFALPDGQGGRVIPSLMLPGTPLDGAGGALRFVALQGRARHGTLTRLSTSADGAARFQYAARAGAAAVSDVIPRAAAAPARRPRCCRGQRARAPGPPHRAAAHPAAAALPRRAAAPGTSGANTPPVALDVWDEVKLSPVGSSFNKHVINVLSSCHDADGDELRVSQLSQPTLGRVAVIDDPASPLRGALTYDAPPGGGRGAPPNRAPVVPPREVNLTLGSRLPWPYNETFQLELDLLAGAADPDGDALAVTGAAPEFSFGDFCAAEWAPKRLKAKPSDPYDTETYPSDHVFTLTFNRLWLGLRGTDPPVYDCPTSIPIKFWVWDGKDTTQGTLHVKFALRGDPPRRPVLDAAAVPSYEVAYGGALEITNLTAYGHHPDGMPMGLEVVTPPAHGLLSFAYTNLSDRVGPRFNWADWSAGAGGRFTWSDLYRTGVTYTPTGGHIGSDAFTFRLTDNTDLWSSLELGTVRIDVRPAPRPACAPGACTAGGLCPRCGCAPDGAACACDTAHGFVARPPAGTTSHADILPQAPQCAWAVALPPLVSAPLSSLGRLVRLPFSVAAGARCVREPVIQGVSVDPRRLDACPGGAAGRALTLAPAGARAGSEACARAGASYQYAFRLAPELRGARAGCYRATVTTTDQARHGVTLKLRAA
ncbi:hypothetical protein HT031_005572 [Scenedesmus sp. PABB004]|nr:hypothetical protein HT031_005572 [Scenedesmus sp. PABB004]